MLHRFLDTNVAISVFITADGAGKLAQLWVKGSKIDWQSVNIHSFIFTSMGHVDM